MAFKIVNGKLVRITDQRDFGTPEQKRAGRRITGTLGVISETKTPARRISEIFSPPPPAPKPSGSIITGPGPTPLSEQPEFLREVAAREGAAPTGTLGLERRRPTGIVGLFQSAANTLSNLGLGAPSSSIQLGTPGVPATSTGGRGEDPRQFGINQRAPTLPASAQTPGGREIRHRPAVPSAPAPIVPPATERQLSYLDTIREVDPDRALEQARFQSATIGRNTPESELATNVFFTEHAIFDQGQIPRNASENVWNVIAQRAGYEGTGAELLAELGYIPIGGGLWFLPDGDTGGAGGGIGGTAQGGGFRLLTSRAPIFSGQPGRFSGTRGASLGMTNWRGI
jgi:hypothetical protein